MWSISEISEVPFPRELGVIKKCIWSMHLLVNCGTKTTHYALERSDYIFELGIYAIIREWMNVILGRGRALCEKWNVWMKWQYRIKM